jgi:hypothetical protein
MKSGSDGLSMELLKDPLGWRPGLGPALCHRGALLRARPHLQREDRDAVGGPGVDREVRGAAAAAGGDPIG